MPPVDVVLNPAFTSYEDSLRRLTFADDRLCQLLARDPRVRLAVAQPFKWFPATAADHVRARFHEAPAAKSDDVLVIRPFRTRRYESLEVPRVREEALRWSRFVEHRTRRHGMQRPHLILFNPFLAGFGEFPFAASVTHVAFDAYGLIPSKAKWSCVIDAAYTSMAQRAIPIAAVAPELLRELHPGGRSLLWPNGIDRADWITLPEPEPAATGLARPVAIYVGALDGRIDPRAIGEISRALGTRGGTVVLLGPEYNDRTRRAVADLDNVRLVGAVPPTEVPAWIAAADIALVPHVDTQQTRTMSPLKLYEYLAAGLQVVATDLEPMRGVHEAVTLVDTHGDWGRATSEALSRRRLSEVKRVAFVEANSWESRSEALLQFCGAL